MSPVEYCEAVLVLTELLLDLSPHAFGLSLQRDEDGLLTYLQQVQKALPEDTHAVYHNGTSEYDSNTDLKWHIVMITLEFLQPVLWSLLFQ